LACARFFSDTSNFLASAGKDGQVIVWHLAEKEDEDEEKRMSCTQIAVIKFGDFDAGVTLPPMLVILVL
jgi:hypothetical protein